MLKKIDALLNFKSPFGQETAIHESPTRPEEKEDQDEIQRVPPQAQSSS